MTFQQLKYMETVAECGSISVAAKKLFISQPSLTNAIHELETNIQKALFIRTPRGMQITQEGMEFLGYAKQVLQQMSIMEDRYGMTEQSKQYFCVSTQHYTFAANAFVELVRKYGKEAYEFTLYEGKTYEIIENVRNLRSELGIIYMSNFNRVVIQKLLKENNLEFFSLFTTNPHVFLSKEHPLARKKKIMLEELERYPCVTFDQGINNSFYFAEEILSTRQIEKHIKVTDRAAVVNFLIGLNAYTISTGVFPTYLHGNDIISVPLLVDEIIEVGVIRHKDMVISNLGTTYIEALRTIAKGI